MPRGAKLIGMNQSCSVDGCETPAMARGWCGKHYDRWRRQGDPLIVRTATTCNADGCQRPCVGQGWCQTHYSRYVKAPLQKQRRLDAKTDRHCIQCGAPLDAHRRSGSVFCSRECKHAEFVASGRQRESVRRSYYKRKYGLTPEQAQTMRESGCDVCGSNGGFGRFGQLHIDHDHVTGRIRGVLCHGCNTGIGQLQDDPALLRRAADYLEGVSDGLHA